MTARPGFEPSRRWISGARRLLGPAFWALGFLAVATFLWEMGTGPTQEESLRAGVDHANTEQTSLAEREFLAAAEGEDPNLAAMAFHNLALLSVRRSLDSSPGDAEGAALEAIGYAETALSLLPGSDETALLLEVALRKLAEVRTSGRDPGRPSTIQQSRASGADTEDEALGRSEPGRVQEGFAEAPLSAEAASRLLASFRLMERDGVLMSIRSRIGSGPAMKTNGRRGPPW